MTHKEIEDMIADIIAEVSKTLWEDMYILKVDDGAIEERLIEIVKEYTD